MKPSVSPRYNPTVRKSEHSHYNLRRVLTGQHCAVACIAAHPLGTHIATGGEKGTNIWDLGSGLLIPPPTRAGERGMTTAIVWITKPDDVEDGLAYGTEDGYLCIWRRKRNEDTFTEIYCDRLTGGKDGQEISSLAYDPSSKQLAVVHRAESVHRFVIDGSMHPRTIKSVSIPKHWPQGVAFGQVGVRGPELWSFGREDGVIYVLNDEGKVLSTKTTGTVIGHAVLDVKEDAILLDDVSQGVALYTLSGTERVKTFEVPGSQYRTRNVAFHDASRCIISGSDHGSVYIFDRRTGSIHDVLHSGVKGWVQSIAAIEVADVPLILVGPSGENTSHTAIQVWEKSTVLPVEKEAKKERGIIGASFRTLFIILSCLFIFEDVLKVPVLDYFGQGITWAINHTVSSEF